MAGRQPRMGWRVVTGVATIAITGLAWWGWAGHRSAAEPRWMPASGTAWFTKHGKGRFEREVKLSAEEARELWDVVAHSAPPLKSRCQFYGRVTLVDESGESREVEVGCHMVIYNGEQMQADQAKLSPWLEKMGLR